MDLKLSISEVLDSQKSSNGDLMQPFFGRDYPLLTLFEQKILSAKIHVELILHPSQLQRKISKLQKVTTYTTEVYKNLKTSRFLDP